MPLGLDVTDPDPRPAIVRLKVNCSKSNVAVHLTIVSIVIVAVCPFTSRPQPLDHPANVDPLAASAVSVTTVPAS